MPLLLLHSLLLLLQALTAYWATLSAVVYPHPFSQGLGQQKQLVTAQVTPAVQMLLRILV
jgi:hypothetical protein